MMFRATDEFNRAQRDDILKLEKGNVRYGAIFHKYQQKVFALHWLFCNRFCNVGRRMNEEPDAAQVVEECHERLQLVGGTIAYLLLHFQKALQFSKRVLGINLRGEGRNMENLEHIRGRKQRLQCGKLDNVSKNDVAVATRLI
jgi:hypothetical protein